MRLNEEQKKLVEDNHNFALDAGIFVHNSVKILEDGTKVKSVGKDISDSLGGAIYNAILSVDVNELDYLENITIAETGIATLNSYENVADRLFGFNRDARGNLIQMDNKTTENEDEPKRRGRKPKNKKFFRKRNQTPFLTR